MKKLLITAMALSALTMSAHQKLDLGSRARLRTANAAYTVVDNGESPTIRRANKVADASTEMVRGFVYLVKGADRSEIEAVDGVNITGQRGHIILFEATRAALEALDACGSVDRIVLESPVKAKMNLARAATGIDKIHSGLDLPRAYTGEGVIAGIVDGGFDPNHVNFKNADGTSRIKSFTYFRQTQSGSYVEENYGADYIPNIDTENSTTYHGTHTLGILAGSYRGPVTAARKINSFQGENVEMDNPYYGVAYGADIAVACGAMTDYYVAMGCDAIGQFAYEQDKPYVLNLSMGSNVGPHDGTSTICQFLDMLVENDPAVVCLSAGNEGDLPIALHKRFTADDTSVGTMFYPAVYMTSYQNVCYGETYFYSDTEKQLDVQAVIVNTSRNAVAMRMPLPEPGTIKYYVSSTDYQEDDTDVVSPLMGKYLTGYVGLGCDYDEVSGRFYVLLHCMTWDNVDGSNSSGKYKLGFVVNGEEGQRVDIFNDGVYNNFSAYGLDGYTDGMTDGTISDMATGFNSVIVGSYNVRDDWAAMDKGVYGYQNTFPSGKISTFTSYGTLYDGRTLPTVCAPGATVVSSTNEYYLQDNNYGNESRLASLEADGRTYSWDQSIGTSMAAPIVTGSIALWMEANPYLTYKDVLEIIAATSIVDDDVLAANPVQRGYGKFDAHAGLKEAIKRNSIVDANVDDAAPIITALPGRSFKVSAIGAGATDVTVHDLTGRHVVSVSGNEEVTVNLDGVTRGIYLFTVNNSHTQRVIVK